MRAWVAALAALGLSGYVALSLYARAGLARVPGLGFDPLVGFLFSPVPLLRLSAALQLGGAILAVVGALLMLQMGRTLARRYSPIVYIRRR